MDDKTSEQNAVEKAKLAPAETVTGNDEAREYFVKHGLDPLHVLMKLHQWYTQVRPSLSRWGIHT